MERHRRAAVLDGGEATEFLTEGDDLAREIFAHAGQIARWPWTARG